MATAPEVAPTQKFMSIWRSPKPVIAQVHGWCVGGGSDFALCADLVVASDDAVIGTPYSRMWGAYLSGMWIYRLGLAKAKEHALTGRPLTGKQAAEIELINRSVPFAELEATVAELADELCRIPLSQLQAMKLVVNHAYENMGLASTQTLGPILDGLMRNTPDALEFIETARDEGVRAVVEGRDGPWGDYSQAPPELQARPLARDRAMIWFLRHGDAADGADDFARELTEKGERQSQAAGEALAALGVEFDACLTSPRVRARQTAELACEALGLEPEEAPELSGGDFDARDLAAGRDDVLLVGHEPDFSRAVGDLTGARVDMKKGGLAAVDGDDPDRLLRPAQIKRIP